MQELYAGDSQVTFSGLTVFFETTDIKQSRTVLALYLKLYFRSTGNKLYLCFIDMSYLYSFFIFKCLVFSLTVWTQTACHMHGHLLCK